MYPHKQPLLFFIVGIGAGGCFYYFPHLSLSLPLLCLFVNLKKISKASALTSVVAFFVGFAYSLLAVPHSDISRLVGQEVSVKAYPVSVAKTPEDKDDIYIQTIKVASSNLVFLNQKELPIIAKTPLKPNYYYRITGRIPSDAYALNPYGPTENLKINAKSVQILELRQVPYFEAIRWRINEFFVANLSPEVSAFVMSIVTGDRSMLSYELKDAFARTGIIHIISISGSHFGLLLFVSFLLTKACLKILPERLLNRLAVIVTINQISALMCLPLIICYYLIAVSNVPAFRAFVMILISLAGLVLSRDSMRINTILVAGAIVLLITPDAFWDLSFELSFMAVLSIAYVVRFFKPNGSKIRQFVKSSIFISLVATLSTAGLTIYHFYGISLIAALSNLIIVPIVGIVILPLSLLSAFEYLSLGTNLLAMPLSWLCEVTLTGSKMLAEGSLYLNLPAFAAVLLVFYCGGCLYIFITNLNVKQAVLVYSIVTVPIVAFFSYKAVTQDVLHVTILDVGQGSSTVITLPDKRLIVIDTGKSGLQTAHFVKSLGTNRIDALLLTHSDSDHTGGLKTLSRRFKISEIWDNGFINYKNLPPHLTHKSLKRGDVIQGHGYQFVVLHPSVDSYDSLTNNDLSLVLKLIGYNTSFLFTADIESEAIQDVLSGPLASDVLVLPHHGSAKSLNEEFYEAVKPSVVVISVGRANPYGHPHSATLEALKDKIVFRTDVDGAIGFAVDRDGKLSVLTASRFRLTPVIASAFTWKSLTQEWLNVQRLFALWI